MEARGRENRATVCSQIKHINNRNLSVLVFWCLGGRTCYSEAPLKKKRHPELPARQAIALGQMLGAMAAGPGGSGPTDPGDAPGPGRNADSCPGTARRPDSCSSTESFPFGRSGGP